MTKRQSNEAQADRMFEITISYSKNISTGDIPRLVPDGPAIEIYTLDLAGFQAKLAQLNVHTRLFHAGWDAEGRDIITAGRDIISLARIAEWHEITEG